MAAPQSSPSCAPTGLLLLLIGVISTNLPEVHTKPEDFWCKPDHRDRRMESIVNMTRRNCTGLDVLPSPVQLPCTRINRLWSDKSAKDKHADVLKALQMFQLGVQRVKNECNLQCPQCQASLLEDLEQSITILVNIVRQADVQSDEPATRHPSEQICNNSNSFRETVENIRLLLKGKLRLLAIDMCAKRTFVNNGRGS